MVHLTRENGHLERPMVKDHSLMLKETFTLVNGGMTKHMGTANTDTSMVPHMKDSGLMICSMDRALSSGLMDQATSDNMFMDRRRELASINGVMGASSEANGRRIKSMALVSILG